MPDRGNKSNIKSVTDKMFEEASKKIKNADDKLILENLRKLLSTVEDDLLEPKP
jgi:hypothetical protein